MLHSVLELARVLALIFPFVLAEAVWLAKLVLTSVNVAHSEDIGALPMFKTVLPFALVSVSILPLMDTISICF